VSDVVCLRRNLILLCNSYVPLDASLVTDDLCLRWFMLASAMPAMHSFYATEESIRMPYTLPGAYTNWIRRAIEYK